MNNFVEVKTILGKKKISKNTVTLSHEHICCYSEYLNIMSKSYLDKASLAEKSADILKNMKEKYGVGLFIDCTPINIGRDIELLKKVSELSGVDIVSSCGFYYNDEPIIDCMSAETLVEYIYEDANNTCAGIIKAAVEYDTVSPFNIKLLKASAIAQKRTGLPIILHTNANDKNGIKAVEILFCENVNPKNIVVGHLSDTNDNEYIKNFAKSGCWVALDRMYDNTTEEYITSKINQINALCEAGYVEMSRYVQSKNPLNLKYTQYRICFSE
ncbi:MAG: hypothetical protein SPH44_09685 [Eubacteriales bacterium]|nr:hypothetical protein [Eubacteriales bacterium]